MKSIQYLTFTICICIFFSACKATQALVQPIEGINCLTNIDNGLGIGEFNPEWIVAHNIKTIVEPDTRLIKPILPKNWDVTEFNDMGYPLETYVSSRYPKLKQKGKPKYGKDILIGRHYTYESKDSFLIQHKKMELYGKYKEESDPSFQSIVLDKVINLSLASKYQDQEDEGFTQYMYDTQKKIQIVKNSKGQIIRLYEYPGRNQIKYTKFYHSLKTKDELLFQFDKKGKLVELQDLENGNISQYEYLPDGRLNKILHYWGPVLTNYISFEYYN